MSEIGETWKAIKEQRKKERAESGYKKGQCFLDYAREELPKHGITFTEHNDGYHSICTKGDLVADFWPSTGKYKLRHQNGYGRGIQGLISAMYGARR